MVSVLAVSIGFLVGGTLIVEQVYALPGIGQLMINAILQRDFPVVQAWRSSSRSWWCSSTCWPTSRTRCSIREFGSTDDDAAETILETAAVEHRRGFRRRWYRTPSFVAGLSILGLITCSGRLLRSSPGTTRRTRICSPRSKGRHSITLGTDDLGRDVLTRLLYAARTDLQIAFLAVLIPFVLGTAVGLLAGYFGGRGHDRELVRERRRRVPVLRPHHRVRVRAGSGTRNIYIAIALVGWVSYTRIVRGEVLVTKRREYVPQRRQPVSRAVRILRRHVLPNVITQAIVYAMSDIVLVILAIVTLGYLGLGVQPPTPTGGA